MPWPVALGVAGKVTACQVAPRSVDLSSPSCRVPSHRVSLSRGSTSSRSPQPRPSSLAPSFTVRSVRFQVAPRSSDRSTAPLPAQDCAYVPRERYSRFGWAGSTAMASTPSRFQSSQPMWSVSGTHRSVRSSQR